MNAEQASKQANAEADPPLTRGRPKAGREASDACTDLLPPGYWRQHAWKMKEAATREALFDASRAAARDTPFEASRKATGTPRGNGRVGRVADELVVPRMRGNARGGKGP